MEEKKVKLHGLPEMTESEASNTIWTNFGAESYFPKEPRAQRRS